MKRVLFAVAAAALVSGCATSSGYTDMGYTPLVDLKPGQGLNYQQDLSECAAYAQQRAGAGASAAGGAVFGAIVGGLLGAALGGHNMARDMAILGGATAAGQGAAMGEGTQRDIIRRCMSGRGYTILD